MRGKRDLRLLHYWEACQSKWAKCTRTADDEYGRPTMANHDLYGSGFEFNQYRSDVEGNYLKTLGLIRTLPNVHAGAARRTHSGHRRPAELLP
jgi:hypothetical protein